MQHIANSIDLIREALNKSLGQVNLLIFSQNYFLYLEPDEVFIGLYVGQFFSYLSKENTLNNIFSLPKLFVFALYIIWSFNAFSEEKYFISASATQSYFLRSEAGKFERSLSSQSGKYHLIMQMDGRLALYKGDSPLDRSDLKWSVNGAPGLGNYFLNLQNDGNLAVWSGIPGTPSAVASGWTSGTPGLFGNYFLIVEDGRVAVYRGTGPQDNKGLVWSNLAPCKTEIGTVFPTGPIVGTYVLAKSDSNFFLRPGECLISPNRQFMAVLQAEDGNFVVYPTSSIFPQSSLWDSKTFGNPKAGLLVQQDGHVVIYKEGGIIQGGDGKFQAYPGQAIFQSNSASTPFADYFLILKDDSNLELYRGTGPENNQGIIWAAKQNTISKLYCAIFTKTDNGNEIERQTFHTDSEPEAREAARKYFNFKYTGPQPAWSLSIRKGGC